MKYTIMGVMLICAWPTLAQSSYIRTEAYATHSDHQKIHISSKLTQPIVHAPPSPILSRPIKTQTLSSQALFGFDSSHITNTSALNGLVKTLRQSQAQTISIIGYTDSRGTRAYNQRLSEQRAKSVKRYLKQKAPQHTYITEGKGEQDPIATNMYQWGRKQNRRVVITFAS
ncbi:OmpA family protein (plasmid) [Photobacterium damselae subsp. damselae]|uniref:OmpA family protein n=1 Tax=Photobacterium damselae TaxID=38293 RepID=UPI00311B16D5